MRGTLSFYCSLAGKELVNLINFRDHLLRSFVAFLPEGLPFRPNEGWNGSVFQYWRKLEKMVPIYQGSIPKRINKISPLSIGSIEKRYITASVTILAIAQSLNSSLENSRQNSIVAVVTEVCIFCESCNLNSSHHD